MVPGPGRGVPAPGGCLVPGDACSHGGCLVGGGLLPGRGACFGGPAPLGVPG